MRLPSDAQAAVLSCMDDHAREGDQVYAGQTRADSWFVSLYVERTGAEVPEGARPPAVFVGTGYHNLAEVLLRFAGVDRARAATLAACVRHGWLDMVTTRDFTTKCVGVSWRPAGQRSRVDTTAITPGHMNVAAGVAGNGATND